MVFAALSQRLKATIQKFRLLAQWERRAVDAARLDDVLDMLERDACLKGEMLDELREASRVGEGTLLHRSSQVDLAELVRSMAESFVPLARESNVTLTVRCAAASVVISADSKDMTHIFSRLIACAIASSERGGTVDCELSLHPEWISLVVRVHERAEGAPRTAADLDTSMWEQFRLSEVRKLVGLHGGVVRVAFEGPRSGPVFMVMLPGDRAVAPPSDGKPPIHNRH